MGKGQRDARALASGPHAAAEDRPVRSIPVTPAAAAQSEKKEHKSFFERLKDVFK